MIRCIKIRDESELYHYGVKGMKWGVRRTPEQLGHKKKVAKILKHDNIVTKAIRSGKVLKSIKHKDQKKHNLSTRLPGRSYIYGDDEYAQELVDKLSGTGTAVISKNGKWTSRERVTNSEIIGVFVDKDTGQEFPTKCGMIIYSNKGTHIYPRRKGEDDND